MKEQLDRLRELQELDLELDKLKNKKQVITDRLELNKAFLNKLVDDLESQKQGLEAVKLDECKKKEELRALNESLQKRQKRLTTVTSAKEYALVEKEIESQKKSVDKLREEVVFLVEEINSSSESIANKEEKIVQLRESIAIEIDGSKGELTSYDKHIEELKKKEENARKGVSKPVMYKYDFIRKRRPGQAIIAATDGHCEGCFMALPPQEFIEIMRGEKLITCPSCQRILYYKPSEKPKEEQMKKPKNYGHEDEEE